VVVEARVHLDQLAPLELLEKTDNQEKKMQVVIDTED
jgi:hypothetical protein